MAAEGSSTEGTDSKCTDKPKVWMESMLTPLHSILIYLLTAYNSAEYLFVSTSSSMSISAPFKCLTQAMPSTSIFKWQKTVVLQRAKFISRHDADYLTKLSCKISSRADSLSCNSFL